MIANQLHVGPKELHKWIQDGVDFTVLDVRSRERFDAWHLEGVKPLRMINVPYFEMMEATGEEDLVDAVIAYGTQHWVNEIPADRPVLAVCARAATSVLVARGLRQLGYEAYSLQGGMSGWGDYYAVQKVEMGASGEADDDGRTQRGGGTGAPWVFQVSRPARGCLSYVIASGGEAVVIDPLRHTQVYVDLLKEHGLRAVGVFDTHGHADHISGGVSLAKELGVPYYLHPYDAIHPLDVMPATIEYVPLAHGQRFSVGNSTLEAIHVPGHTLGNVVFLLDEKALFSGDTIFVASVARPDLGGKGEAWAPLHYRSLKRLVELPREVTVFPGHFSSLAEADASGVVRGRLADLLKANRDLAVLFQGETSFVSHLLGRLPHFPPQYVDIKRVNAGLLSPDEETASELELGPNVCALASA